MRCISGADLYFACGAKAVTIVIHTVFHVAGYTLDVLGQAAVLLADVEIFVSAENCH